MYNRRRRNTSRSAGQHPREEFYPAAEISRRREEIVRDHASREEALNKERLSYQAQLRALCGRRNIRTARVLLHHIGAIETELRDIKALDPASDFDLVTKRLLEDVASTETDQNYEQQRDAVVGSICGKRDRRSIAVHSYHCVDCQVPLVVQARRSCCVCPQCGVVRTLSGSYNEAWNTERRIRASSTRGRREEASRTSGLTVGDECTEAHNIVKTRRTKRRKTVQNDDELREARRQRRARQIAVQNSRYANFVNQYREDAPEPSREIIEYIVRNLHTVHLQDKSKVREPSVIEILRGCDQSDMYYKLSGRIQRIISGDTVPVFSKSLAARLIQRFKLVIERMEIDADAVEDDDPDEASARRKVINHKYLTRQFLLQEGLRDKAECFENHKTRDVLHDEDVRFSAVCETLREQEAGGMDWSFEMSA